MQQLVSLRFLDRHYPASSVVRASPPPWRPGLAPHGVPVGSVHTTDRASRVASIPLLYACRRQYPGGTGQCARRSLPSRWQPSPFYRRVDFRITRFEACSAFTKVAARILAEPPMAALLIGVLQTMSLPPSPAPTATGWSDSCRAGFAPAEGRRLRTAHGKVGLDGRARTSACTASRPARLPLYWITVSRDGLTGSLRVSAANPLRVLLESLSGDPGVVHHRRRGRSQCVSLSHVEARATESR